MNEESIFNAAREKSDPEARAAYLAEACAGDPALRRRVEALLAALSESGDFLEQPVIPGLTFEHTSETTTNVGPPSSWSDGPAFSPAAARIPIGSTLGDPSASPAYRTVEWPTLEAPGTRIGPYRLIERIGQGGMGSVYLAEQETPVRRTVALKIIKPGMDTEQVVARFAAERQALALMDSPNIAKVLDAGATSTGRPYFVMELVRGTPITDYCDQAHLSPRERIELLLPVCQAIQHAHQKGIIHRDIKPSNILVILRDGKPVPKVIDFGIAKAIDQDRSERRALTDLGAIVGTLEYMSPEQAGLDAPDIDTRSDIYSLGVLLYELLTGTTPLLGQSLRKLVYTEALRRICVEEPPRPSSRLSESREDMLAIAASRHTEPARLARLVRGELDWIVMKALEKDRSRRYETASALARDLERYLKDEPVEACPPSARYRLFKAARKHRMLLATGVCFVSLLIIGAALCASLAIRANRAERAAMVQRDAVADALTTTVAAQQQADRAAATVRAVNDFLLNDLLAQASSEIQSLGDISADPNIQVRTLLDRASDRIAGKFPGQPAVEASIRLTIGATYRRLGLYTAKAQDHLQRSIALNRRVLGAEHPATLEAMGELGLFHRLAGKPAQAEPLLVRVRDARRRTLGPEHPDTLLAMINLAVLHAEQGKQAEAEALLVKALEVSRRTLGAAHKDTYRIMHHLGWYYRAQGVPTLAEPLLIEAFEGRRRTVGAEHPFTLSAMVLLGTLYLDEDKLAQAEPLVAKAHAISSRTLGAEHPATLSAMHVLGRIHLRQGKLDKAEPLLVKVVDGFRSAVGEEHPSTLFAMNNLATTYLKQGRLAEAGPLLVKVLEMRQRTLGAEHKDTLSAMNSLAVFYMEEHRPAEAEPLILKALDGLSRTLGPEHLETLWTVVALGAVYREEGKPAAAEPLLVKGLDGLRRIRRHEHATTLWAMANLGALYRMQGRLEEAEPLLVQVFETRTRTLGAEHADTISAMISVALLYRDQGTPARAEPLLLRALEARRRTLGAEHAGTLEAVNELQFLLLSQRPSAALAGSASWRKIVDVLSEAVQRKPEAPALHYRRALSLFLAGDRAGHHRACDETLEQIYTGTPARFQGRDGLGLSRAARACMAAPDCEAWPELSPLLRLADAELPADARSVRQYMAGLASYRQGEYEQAILHLGALREAFPEWEDIPLAWPLLAMAHQQLGHSREAWQWLHQAERLESARANEIKPETFGPRTRPSGWLEFLILRRQAELLVLDAAFPAQPFSEH